MASRQSAYVRKENRKRAIRSWGSAFLLYLIVISAYLGWDLFLRKDLTMNQGPVLIRLGEPEGLDEPTPAPQEEQPVEQPPEEPVTPPEPEPEPEPENTPVKEPEPAPELPAPELPSEPVVEQPKADTPPVEKSTPAPPEPIKGSDAGNNYELTSEGGEIGRSLWVPIYLYLPMPRYLDAEIENGDLVYLLEKVQPDPLGLRTAEENRELLLRYYEKKSRTRTLELKGQVPLQDRPELWAILEGAGYDMRNAEYKKLPNLSSITINFSVVPSGSSRANDLVELELKKSSGYEEFDEAVLYAFQQSSYYNSTDEPIKGRFTYRFY